MKQFIFKYMAELQALTGKKLLLVLGLTITSTMIGKFIETYIYSDWSFLISLSILIVLDTITGVLLAIKNEKFSSYDFLGVFYKVALYCIVLITVHVLMTFQIGGHHPTNLGWIDDLMMSGMVVREAISIIENIGILYPKLLPSWILKKLKDFDKNGKYINQ